MPHGIVVTGSYPELPRPGPIGRLALYSSVNVQATRSLCIDPCRWTVACYRPRPGKRASADAIRPCQPPIWIDRTKASSKYLIQPLFRLAWLVRKLRTVLSARPTAADSRHSIACPAGSLDLARSDPLGRPPGLGYPWLHRRPALLGEFLKNIQRQTEFGVSAAQAALQCANAALESSQATSWTPAVRGSSLRSEPFLTVEHGFKVMATNRGRTPARILAKADCVKVAQDETKLPATPDFDSGKSATPFGAHHPPARRIRRHSPLSHAADVRSYCASDDQLKLP